MAGNHSSWRAEDLLDLERCGLATDLASTNLGPGSENGWGGNLGPEADITYDMRLVLEWLMAIYPHHTPTTPSYFAVKCLLICWITAMSYLFSPPPLDQWPHPLTYP